jgi:SPX domain
MVGFGSSLRLARRTGWEDGYFDYETLKLLLSQIEAVYEEGEDQADRYRPDGAENDEASWYHPDRHNPQTKNNKNKNKNNKDYYLRQNPFGGRQQPQQASNEDDDGGGGSRGLPLGRAGSSRRKKHDSSDDDDDDDDEDKGHPHHHHHHRRRRSRDEAAGTSSASRIRTVAAAAAGGLRDFREDIFVESDSELEFAGSDEWGLRAAPDAPEQPQPPPTERAGRRPRRR